MIEVKNLVKRFGEITALGGVTFSVKKGEIVGFLGPNGAGKTTALKIITCYLAPTEGKVTIDGKDVSEHSLEVRHRFGYMPENAPLYTDMMTSDYLTFMGQLRGVSKKNLPKRVDRVIQQCGLGGVAGQLVGTLSKGYRQRVCLAQALVHDPDILVLDEPTVGLDPNQIVEIRSLIKELGRERTVILSSHILPEVLATCDRLLVVHQGRIVADGTPSELEAAHTEQARVNLRLQAAPELSAEKVSVRLSGFDWVENVDARAESGELVFGISAAEGMDIRQQLVSAATQEGWPLLEVTRERVGLERIFYSLTQE